MEEKTPITSDTPVSELEKRLLSEYDKKEVKNIIDMFNLNIKKKNVIRTEKLSELQDLISDQMVERVLTNADAFSNKDLLEYFKTIQETISKSDMSSDVTVPVQIAQQNNININTAPELDRASRNRVIAAIESILGKQNNIEEVEVVTEESETSSLESNISQEG